MPGRQQKLARPVISVGNLAFGGRGKTPTVAHLARLLVGAGERPSILSRGYGRRRPEAGVVITSDGTHLLADVDRSGDEPMLLAREVPGAAVLVCDQRALAGVLAEQVLGATVHLLDDGFQHLQLARDLDLVLLGPSDLADRSAPVGRLREPVRSLAAADAILVDQDADGVPAPTAAGFAAPVFGLRRTLGAPVDLTSGQPQPVDGRSVVALAGIAEPRRFSRALEDAGWTVSETLTFSDHHRYTSRDLRRIADVAEKRGALVVTTSKDAMRLLPCRPLPMEVAVMPLLVTIEPQDDFRRWLFGRLREIRA